MSDGNKSLRGVELRQHRPTVELLMLAGPTIAQMASYTLMQFIDTWMLSRVGLNEPTAVANTGMLAFSVISFGMGVLWVVNTLVSQNYGRQDFAACGRYLWQGIWFSVLFSLLLVPVIGIAKPLFGVFGHSQELTRDEVVYFQIVLAATFVKLMGAAFGQFLLAINRPMRVFLATAGGVGVNVVAAYAMVLGHLGVEPMGVRGAAWAQNIGVTVETLLLIGFALQPTIRRRFGVGDWRLRLRELRLLLMLGIPAGVQIVADVLAWSLFSMLVMGRFGTDAMAANAFMMRYMAVSFMPAFGISVAITALVGRYIGMGRVDIAARRAHLGFALMAVYMVACGIGFYVWRESLIGLFSDEPEVVRIGAVMLTFAAVYQFFDALYIAYNGALRGAGDTLFSAVVTAGLCWGVTVFGGYMLARHFPQFGPAGPWTAATLYGIILGVVIFLRFARGGWRAIHLVNGPPSNQAAPSATVTA